MGLAASFVQGAQQGLRVLDIGVPMVSSANDPRDEANTEATRRARATPAQAGAVTAEPLGELLRQIADDIGALARDEVALARLELRRSIADAALPVAAMLLSGVVLLFGLGLLCATAIVLLEPWLPPLWARMLLMSGLYVLSGGAACAGLLTQLRRALAGAKMPRTAHQVRETFATLRRKLNHG